MDESESAPLNLPENQPGNVPENMPAPSAAQTDAPFAAADSRQPELSNDSLTILTRQIPDSLRTPDSPLPPTPPQALGTSAASPNFFAETNALQNDRFGFVQPGALRAGTLPHSERPPESITPKPRAIFITAALLVLTLFVWFAANRAGWLAPDPLEVARAQLLDLDQGRWHAAYDLFSPRYRAEVSFEVWRDMVLMHSRMFRTRELRFANDREWNGGAALEAHVVAESGDRYLARFTLVYAEGHWWVDDLHWGREPDIEGQVTI